MTIITWKKIIVSKKDRIFVAGHNGLVGSAVLRKLKELNYSNIIVAEKKKLNLLDQKKVFNFLKKNKIKSIIICAARVGGIKANNTYKGDFIYENLMIQNNLIHGAKINGILNKVDKPKEEVISDDDASHEFNKSDSTPINEVNDNDSNDDLEYIPSISSLIDTKDEGDTSSLLEFEEEDVKTNEVNGTSAEKINIQSIKNSKASKKSSILDDNSFDFIPPKKSKKKKA